MAKNVLVVESPAKAKTINKYLGKDFIVLASYGHVRELLSKGKGVDIEHDFTLNYELIDRNKRHVKAIEDAIKTADNLYLATDPDREGEAISWHIYSLLNDKKRLKDKKVVRVVFNEITQSAIQDAVANPRAILSDLVDAQQARSALDYLIGFNLSPLLWRKVGSGLSAGRVQSPALRLICQREAEIEAFQTQEYWSIKAELSADKKAFSAKLVSLAGKKLKQFDITNEAQANQAVSDLRLAAAGTLTVQEVDKKERKRHPAPPFITSTLQQEASRKLGFGAQRTMRLAQQLYEGQSIDGQSVGLITYMRTDSVHLSNEAVDSFRNHIQQAYGAEYLPEKARHFQNKSKNAQEAHEAIRPTTISYTPEQIKGKLDFDLYRLYELIYKRALASQMQYAVFDTVAVTLTTGDAKGNSKEAVGEFKANGSTLKFPGFIRLYQETVDEDNQKEEDTLDSGEGTLLPPLTVGQAISLLDLAGQQHFTEPPPRYSEATLVKTLEEYGIGRPSTYASIIQTLLNREYVLIESKRLYPTNTGKVVSTFLSQHFSQYVDYHFTAGLEDELDEVARGEKKRLPLMNQFWQTFSAQLEAKKDIPREEVMQARDLGVDPKTGKPISVRYGRYGPFVQIGRKEDEEKPRFASLTENLKFDSVNLADALKLFELPRELGLSRDGEVVRVNIGRFGPYVQYDKLYASVGKEDDVYAITLERAQEIIDAKKEADKNKFIQSFPEANIQVLNGRFGPYIKHADGNAKIPKDTDPATLSLEDCLALVAEAAKKGKPKRGSTKKVAGKKAATKKTVSKAKTTTTATKTTAKSPAKSSMKTTAKTGAKASSKATTADKTASKTASKVVSKIAASKAETGKTEPKKTTPASGRKKATD